MPASPFRTCLPCKSSLASISVGEGPLHPKRTLGKRGAELSRGVDQAWSYVSFPPGGTMSLFRRRRDNDFAWYQKQLGERLSEMQQRHSNPTFDHSHVVRDHGDFFAGELTDAAMAGRKRAPAEAGYNRHFGADNHRHHCGRDILARSQLIPATLPSGHLLCLISTHSDRKPEWPERGPKVEPARLH